MHHFDHIIGHESLVASLARAAASHTPHHAYIFEGEKGAGKTTLAMAFAKAINCAGDADGPCLSCRVLDSGNHPDTFIVRGTNKTGLGVDDARAQILRPISVKPFRYPYKVFIIEDAGRMSPAAQNMLLKTIEEPAPYGVFIFLTESARSLLPTVRSRCVLCALRPLPDERVQQALSDLPGDRAAFFAKLAQGSIGRAREMAASEDFAAMRALAEEVTAGLGGWTLLDIPVLYKRFEGWKDNIHDLLDILYMCLSAADAPKTDAAAAARRRLGQNAHFQQCIEGMLIDLIGC